MKLSNTERYHFFPSSLAHFADRSARGLLVTPENVSALVELVAEEVETMLQSMAEITYQQGIEQGARRTSIENTLAILNTRFPDANLQTLTPVLEAIDDLNRLKQLNIEASVVDTFHAFEERLQT
ncbi:MAG: hypothetical protein OXL96_16470 [Candidatus Poribacteria bacterium]|nr:hypothetical protein [Candidatus Poribacteria bacterium]